MSEWWKNFVGGFLIGFAITMGAIFGAILLFVFFIFLLTRGGG